MTLVCNDTDCSVPFTVSELSSTVLYFLTITCNWSKQNQSWWHT